MRAIAKRFVLRPTAATQCHFLGTEYLLSGLFSEGSRRGMSVNHMAQLVCKNPAERYGLLCKGDIDVGYDADLVLLDPDETFTVRAAESESSQGYTPFEGVELTGRVKSTYLRGQLVYDIDGTSEQMLTTMLDHQFNIDDAMSTDLVTLPESASVHDAAEVLSGGQLHSVLVVDVDGSLVGIVTSTDLVRYLRDP